MMQKIVGFNPLTPERIAERRAAVLDFISAALFRRESDRQEGRRQEGRRQEGRHEGRNKGRNEGRQDRNRQDRNHTQGARP